MCLQSPTSSRSGKVVGGKPRQEELVGKDGRPSLQGISYVEVIPKGFLKRGLKGISGHTRATF